MANFRFWFKQYEGDILVNETVFREVVYYDLTPMELRTARERTEAELLSKVSEDVRPITRFVLVDEGDLSPV